MARRSITAHDLEQGLGDQLRRPPLSELRGRALWRAIQALGPLWSALGETALCTWLGQYVEDPRTWLGQYVDDTTFAVSALSWAARAPTRRGRIRGIP